LTLPAFAPIGLRFENIDKRYGGLLALRGVSLTIAPGECVVFAGRNGSGKTTLLRIAARLVRPTRGSLSFSGKADGSEESAVRPGFVAHATMVYDELSAEENLLLFAKLQEVPHPENRVETLLQEVGLSERRSSLVRTFSRGMRQRVAIARALLHEPAILLFDEPATGLDPQGVAWLAEAIRRLRDSGRTILMSLHGESEISSLGTRAIRLDAGSVAADTRTGATFRSILTFADA
jgi:heme exporter protein A